MPRKGVKVFCERCLLIGFLILSLHYGKSTVQTSENPLQTDNVQAAIKTGPRKPAYQFRLASDGLPSSGMWKSTPAITDKISGGKLAIAAYPRLGNGAQVWVRDGSGKWIESSDGLKMKSPSCGGGIAFGDLNKDGYPDLVIADHCSGIFVYSGSAKGDWTLVTRELNPEKARRDSEARGGEPSFIVGAEDVTLGDVNEDGYLDIVAGASDQGGITVYLGNGAFEWKEQEFTGLPTAEHPEPQDEQNAGWASQVRLFDINGDGHLDVVASYYKGPSVWLGDGKGHFTAASKGLPRPPVGGLYRGVAVGDINGDGRTDMVFANSVNGVEIFLQQVDCSWKQIPDVFPAMQGGAISVALADLSGSGKPDLIVAGRKTKEPGSNYGVFVLKGDGKGGFEEVDTNLPEAGLSLTWGITTTDLGNDGATDIVLSTGGVVPKARDKKGQPTGQQEIEELSMPRLQVWMNESRGNRTN